MQICQLEGLIIPAITSIDDIIEFYEGHKRAVIIKVFNKFLELYYNEYNDASHIIASWVCDEHKRLDLEFNTLESLVVFARLYKLLPEHNKPRKFFVTLDEPEDEFELAIYYEEPDFDLIDEKFNLKNPCVEIDINGKRIK